MLSEEEIEQLVKETIEIIKPNGIKDMGKVMQEVMKKVSGRADGKVVSEIVKKYLQQ